MLNTKSLDNTAPEPSPDESESFGLPDIVGEYSRKYDSWFSLAQNIAIKLVSIQKDRETISKLIDLFDNLKIPPDEEIKEDLDRVISDCQQFINHFGHTEAFTNPFNARHPQSASAPAQTYLPPDFVREQIINPLNLIKLNIDNYKSKMGSLILCHQDSYKTIRDLLQYTLDMLPLLTQEAYREYLTVEQVSLLEHDVKTEASLVKTYLSSLEADDIDSILDEELKTLLLKLFEEKYKDLTRKVDSYKSQESVFRNIENNLREEVTTLKAQYDVVKTTYINPEKFHEELEKASMHYPDLDLPPKDSDEFVNEIIFFVWIITFKTKSRVIKARLDTVRTVMNVIYMNKYGITMSDITVASQRTDMLRVLPKTNEIEIVESKTPEAKKVIEDIKADKFAFLMQRRDAVA